MKNKKSKTLWGVFFLGYGLMWISANVGIIKHSSFSGLLFSFVLILIGIRIILKGKAGEKNTNKTIEDTSYENHYDDNSAKEEKAFFEKDYTQSSYSNTEKEDPVSAKGNTGKKNYTSFLASHNIQCTEEFTGAEITAIAGSLELDLRNAVITRDIVIDVNCFLGGIEIFLPSGVEVSVSCVPIMGGVESKINGTSGRRENKATVYIRGTCFMGGIEIR